MEFIIENWYYFAIGLVVILVFVLLVSKKPAKKEPAKVEAKTEESKPVEIKKEEAKPAAPVQPVVKKEEVVVEKTETAPVEEEVAESENDDTSTESAPAAAKKAIKNPKYHVSQNKDEKSANFKKWRVRKEGSDKTIKFFDTQKEAISYAEGLAKAADSSVVIHKVDGSIRKQDYSKKE